MVAAVAVAFERAAKIRGGEGGDLVAHAQGAQLIPEADEPVVEFGQPLAVGARGVGVALSIGDQALVVVEAVDDHRKDLPGGVGRGLCLLHRAGDGVQLGGEGR